MLKNPQNSDTTQSFVKFKMNVFILILYTYGLFSISQGGIVNELNKGDPKVSTIIESGIISLNITIEATDLDEYLNPNVDPCGNFYLFSCGKWIQTQKKKYGSTTAISVNDSYRNFIKFIDEFKEGKYNNESKVINTLYKLRNKCNELPQDEIEDCQLEILNFGIYSFSSIFIKKIK